MSDLEKLAALMIRCSFATGHGDTIDDLFKELEWQIMKLRNAANDASKTVSEVRKRPIIRHFRP